MYFHYRLTWFALFVPLVMLLCVAMLIRVAFMLLANFVNFFWRFIVASPAGTQLKTPVAAANPPADGYICGNAQCHAANPPSARFCRRCGQRLWTFHRAEVLR